ncbi:MAG: DUF1573 domain-containing protein [Nitrospirae bacterium]|nr:DUF1573 domain-containing protein [Nitrospirota bacterium]
MKISKKIVLALILAPVIFLVGCVGANGVDNNLLSMSSDSGLIMPTQDIDYEWGDINIMGGDVDHVFAFRNDGEEDLILKGATTSCMCTTATFELPNGEFSPDFGMHDSKKWTYSIKPGEEFKMNVVFDPMAHGPDAIGPIQRSVYIVTSSEANGNYAKADSKSGDMVTELRVSGNVLKESAFKT